MKLLLPVVVFCFLALSQVFGEEFGPKDDLDYWTNGNQIQDEWLQADPFRELLRRMTRKPRPHQFIGLMGKRSSAANAQITRKRHKINSFVGLMGKRSQEEPESYEWATLQNYEERR
ncbi:protachykinin-1 isoform X1 [Astyanax mexicanus]|uniref:Protachykinin-1 isoform X1 n=1 Tax=Astyanax mexicanus TaxID=7994 RepID=A0A8T2M4P7_ASTMX|nr:protachykinin-1 isoform X1 [Astyanax mexicanus]KAG9279598.1 protachykinin-1 isoform X1 [Astyanax mexicanus]